MTQPALDAALVARIDGLAHGRKRSALVDLKDAATRLVDGVAEDATRTRVVDAFATLADGATSDAPDAARLHDAGERLIDLAKPVGQLAVPVAKAVGEVLTASGTIL